MANGGVLNGWKQTITVILSVVAMGVTSMVWLENRFDDLEQDQVISKIEREAISLRLREYGFSHRDDGFSRMQAQKFVDDLRNVADHPIPPIRAWDDTK